MPVEPSSSRLVRWWPLTIIVLLLPLWSVGLFGRWYWTPDEPREADIAWNMTFQGQKSVPELAGVAFCEKPPLAYWASGAAMVAFGKNPPAARLPNLLWALVAVLAVAWLAHAIAGAGMALVAGIALGTFSLSYQVAIWLASDAPLVAGSCLALLGAYRGINATTSKDRLIWYTLMHLGLAGGFLSKNIVAWMVPLSALGGFIIWERRWRELRRWELYAGALVQLAVLVPWVLAVAEQPEGRRFLRIFFYDNLLGRFLPIRSEGGYSDGHRHVPGKYLLELPVYLAPWLFLAAAAVRRGWTACRQPSADRAAWRWIICATVPTLLILSSSTTARGIYLAPVMPGFALAIGLWAARHLAVPDAFERGCLWATAGLMAVVTIAVGPGCLLSAGLLGVALPTETSLAVVLGGLAAGVLGCKVLIQQRRGAYVAALATSVLALNVAVLVAWRALFPVIDRWQDLTPTMHQVAEIAQGRPLSVYQPDETIIANLDYLAHLRLPAVLDAEAAKTALLAEPQRWLLVRTDGGDANLARLRAVGLSEVRACDIVRGRCYALYALAP
jgi:4-amino-4-deoxy-L-arabinose transferase-like glycosyltransferase